MKTLKILSTIPLVITGAGIWLLEFQGHLDGLQIIVPLLVDAMMVGLIVGVIWRKNG